MILMSLVALLDAASEAHRPVAEQLVWHADHQPGADRLLGQVVGAMLETGLACFASTEDGIAPDELPAGRWQMLGPGHWRVWSLKDPHRWCESYLHTLGNYAIYLAAEAVRLPLSNLPWWGPASTRHGRARGSAAVLVDRLQSINVRFALAVHPDGDSWVAVVTGKLPARRTA